MPRHTARSVAARVRTTLLLLTMVAGSGMAACSEGDDGPAAPSGPNVTGTWIGSFANTDMRLTLSQSGGSISGQLRLGPASYAVSGTVDAAGEVRWSSDVHEGNCTTVGSNGMQLQAGGDALSGNVIRTQLPRPCGSEGRRAVISGSATLTRAF